MISLTRRHAWLLPLGFFFFLPLASGRVQEPQTVVRLAPRTVILVRHAEKSAAGDANDPELAPEGQERAAELARLLARAGVTRLIASEFKRTQATLAPLGQRLSLAVETRPAKEIDLLATELVSAEPGSVVVVAGHSNTIPALAARLGVQLSGVASGPQGSMLDDAEYGRVFVLTLPPSGAAVKPSVLELHYGK